MSHLGSSATFSSRATHARFAPDSRRIAVSQQTTFSASFGLADRSKRWQTVCLLVDDFDRADAEETSEILRILTACLLITRRQDNGLAAFNSAATLLSSPHTRPGKYGFLLPKRERGEKRDSIFPVRPLAIRFTHMPSFGPPWLQRSELGRKIPVDLEADAHFDEYRSCP
jgi:hypothetical protein